MKIAPQGGFMNEATWRAMTYQCLSKNKYSCKMGGGTNFSQYMTTQSKKETKFATELDSIYKTFC